MTCEYYVHYLMGSFERLCTVDWQKDLRSKIQRKFIQNVGIIMNKNNASISKWPVWYLYAYLLPIMSLCTTYVRVYHILVYLALAREVTRLNASSINRSLPKFEVSFCKSACRTTIRVSKPPANSQWKKMKAVKKNCDAANSSAGCSRIILNICYWQRRTQMEKHMRCQTTWSSIQIKSRFSGMYTMWDRIYCLLSFLLSFLFCCTSARPVGFVFR